eukprot:10944812-Alexandrium_andersonii.AAC.1
MAGATCTQAREVQWSSSARRAPGQRTPAAAWTLTREPPPKTSRAGGLRWSRSKLGGSRTAW